MSTTLIEQLSYITATLNITLAISLIIIVIISGILNIFVFYRPTLRKTSCGVYFLVASVSNISFVLAGQLPRLLTLSSTSPFLTIFWFCQLRNYFTSSFGLMARGLIVLASLDRLLCCSLNGRIRAWCNVKTSIRILII